MKSIILTLATLFLLGVLAGCGQSGPLYVPGDPSEVQITQPLPESEEDGDENGEDDGSQ
jgi:predicted small lipoprotein YifL